MSGRTAAIKPVRDHGVDSFKGSGRLKGKRTIITGGDTNFGKQMPMKRAGQPAELATAFVMLADPMSSYVSGATIAVTGGKPIL